MFEFIKFRLSSHYDLNATIMDTVKEIEANGGTKVIHKINEEPVPSWVQGIDKNGLPVVFIITKGLFGPYKATDAFASKFSYSKEIAENVEKILENATVAGNEERVAQICTWLGTTPEKFFKKEA